MKTTLHKSTERGQANHGWLNSHHSFSFASYFNPERMGFGALRVLNDDVVDPGAGFDTHPHRDMEIVSIPLAGALKHKDSEGNETIIRKGEVQLMSAGTGVFHSEYNDSNEDDVNFLQIWVIPKKVGIEPRYDQVSFDLEKHKNQWLPVVSPLGSPSGKTVQINQDAYFHLGRFEEGQKIHYESKSKGSGVYLFVIDGSLDTIGETLEKRDAIAFEDADSIHAVANTDSELLAIEVPLKIAQ